jgi:hypothetical protein
VLAVAQEDCIGAPGDDHRHERGDTGSVLDRKGGRQQVAMAEAVGALDAVAESGHGPALGAGRFAAAALLTPILGAAAAASLLTVLRS